MKKRLAVALACLCFAFGSVGCQKEIKEITCDQVIAAYQDAGYLVNHYQNTREGEFVCSVSVEIPTDSSHNTNFIHFYFYETEEQALLAKKENKYNIVMWLFVLPFGEARWLKNKTYGNIHYEYYNPTLYQPFHALIG